MNNEHHRKSQNYKAGSIEFTKTERWAQKPIEKVPMSSIYSLYNIYTTQLPKGKKVEVNTGLVFPITPDTLAMVPSVVPTNFNNNISISRSMIGSGEITLNCINCGENDSLLEPLTQLGEFILVKTSKGAPIVCKDLDETVRGTKGFGSTGIN